MANAENLVNDLGRIIGALTIADSRGLSNLLTESGYVVTSTTPDALGKQSVEALSNPRFVSGLQGLITENAESSISGYNASDGSKDESFSNADGGFWGGFNFGSVTNLLGTGAGVYGSIKASETEQKKIDAQIKLGQQQTELAITNGTLTLEAEKLRLAQIQAQNNAPKNNTLLYAGLGIAGVLMVGLIILAVIKKK
tara:strand:- start:9084 stop:9674 length:591 start_codon:yes stop_codon:yes gene_type:complete